MLAKGNGNVDVCIKNLVRTYRGDVPFERAMGLSRRYIGKTEGIEVARMTVDTKKMIEAYEDRVEIDNLAVTRIMGGDYRCIVELGRDE